MPVRSLPSIRYTTGSTRSYAHTYAARGHALAQLEARRAAAGARRWRAGPRSRRGARRRLRGRGTSRPRRRARAATRAALGSNRYTWNGFSKSAGAFGVITNAVPSGRSARASSATCATGFAKCSMMCDETMLSTLPSRSAERGAVERAEAQAARCPSSGRGGAHRLRAVVGADDEAIGAGEAPGLVADAAADVDRDARAEAREHLAVPGVVEREQRVGCRPVHRAFARELHVLPAPSPRLQAIERTAARGAKAGASRRRALGQEPRRGGGPALDSPRRPRPVRCPVPRRPTSLSDPAPSPAPATSPRPPTSPSSARSRRPRACAGSRSSRGATSTIPRPAAPSCTRRGSPRSGVRRASR